MEEGLSLNCNSIIYQSNQGHCQALGLTDTVCEVTSELCIWCCCSPGCEVMRRVLLSSVWTGFLNPHKASTSCNSIDIVRSCPLLMTTTKHIHSTESTSTDNISNKRHFITKIHYLVKRGCSRWSSTMMISPGSSPGSWSPSPWKTIFWPSLIPVVLKWPVTCLCSFCLTLIWSSTCHICI